MSKKAHKVRITSSFPRALVKQLEKESTRLKKQGAPCGLGNAVTEVVRRHFLGKHGTNNALLRAYEEILSEAPLLKEHGNDCFEKGKIREARRSFLLAASKELEALALLEDPNDQIISSMMIEVIQLLKDGTGYKYLPVVPGGKTANTLA